MEPTQEIFASTAVPDESVPPTMPTEGAETPPSTDPTRRQQAMVALGRRAVAHPSLSVLMQDAGILLAEMFGTELSAVGELILDRHTIRVRLIKHSAGDEPAELIVRDESLNGEHSLAGYVLEVAYPIVVEDLAGESHFRDRLLSAQGVRSAIAVPLIVQGEALGVLAACTTTARRFSEEDILFIESVGHLIATTIGRSHLERELSDERDRSARVLETVNAIVILLDQQWRVVHINRAGEQLTGFDREEIRGRTIDTVLSVPEESDLFQCLARQVAENKEPVEYESYLLTKAGERRRIAWRYQASGTPASPCQTVIATGLDITEQAEAADRARRAEKAAEDARRQLSESHAGRAGTRASDMIEHDSPINAERRHRQRRTYQYRQRLAYVVEGRKPGPDDFFEIECNDIGSGGVSFFSSRPPLSDVVVVELGKPPGVIHMRAQVAHVTRTEQDGRRVYLIGCSYDGRVSLD